VTVAGEVGPTVGVVEVLGLGDDSDVGTLGLGEDADALGLPAGLLGEALGEELGVVLDADEDAALLQPARTSTRTAISALPRARAVRRVMGADMSASPGRSGRGVRRDCRAGRPVLRIYADSRAVGQVRGVRSTVSCARTSGIGVRPRPGSSGTRRRPSSMTNGSVTSRE